jgi:trehalose 6-phosphate synthase/phosphatase
MIMENEITRAYASAKKRLFLLDYDGTLADLKPTPLEAKPTPDILETLHALGQDPKNTVVIVSGRRHQELEEWLGMLPIAFAAEHGLMYKEHGQTWAVTKNLDTSWKPEVMRRMQAYVVKLEGSLVEDKTNALVWHYRNAPDQNTAAELEKQLAAELQPFAERHGLRIMLGSKIVEVQPLGVSKGLAVQHWLDQGGWDFILIAGDDTTDEDMLKAAPANAFTVKVRDGETVASTRIDQPADMLALLNSLR